MSAPIAIVVLNWNGADDTIACLESLRHSTVPVHAIVVDNGSKDDSVERIKASNLADEIVEVAVNTGYAEGNNIGLRRALSQGASVAAVLNNDTVVEPGAVEALLAQLPESRLRAASPDVRYFDEPAKSWFAGGVIDKGWTRHLQADELPREDGPLRPSAWLSGCCIAARRETWERVGLFDPGYFLFFEDSDWSVRAARAGVGLYVATQSTILHKVSRSFARDGQLSRLGSFYFVRNGLEFNARYGARHLPGFARRWLARRTPPVELAFRWLGALAFVLRLRGRAPRVVERLAERLV